MVIVHDSEKRYISQFLSTIANAIDAKDSYTSQFDPKILDVAIDMVKQDYLGSADTNKIIDIGDGLCDDTQQQVAIYPVRIGSVKL